MKGAFGIPRGFFSSENTALMILGGIDDDKGGSIPWSWASVLTTSSYVMRQNLGHNRRTT